ncbi:hypothetical protein KM800_02825 [Clostridium tyrobutyricum]|uniref:hypothetical protein n=1 Tax=Clostridium tyrobutyricum TaxID=1519 RepID=UPI0010A99841|nr:hypothetical protein [Clostridium tyrobutyricum]MBV4418267.1 hypothetical protein [Clostridium tyrobutyricum]QCH27639.1 hypothetical protein EZN00_01237 [Clostridium tyrobutyricum]
MDYKEITATYNINKFSLAMAMNFLGYHFKKIPEGDRKIFVFERTPEFMDCLHELLNLKKYYGKIY